jgi:hypothetical protein
VIVHRIAHAGLVVAAGRLRALVDPLLVAPFECGWNVFEPPVEIDPGGVAGHYNLVLLSHEHMDHFDPRSLDHLDRACPVLHPDGCGLIARALAAMGFRHVTAVRAGQTIEAGGVEVTFTPSDVTFPEVGMLFSHGGRHLWNAVDTEVGDRALALVARRAPRVDVLLAQFQALVEEELGRDGLGSEFPYDVYGRRLAAVFATRPRCVVPSSCGYRYAVARWQDDRGFPVTEADFLADVSAVAPDVAGVSLPPGAALDVRDLTVTPGALPFVRALDPAPFEVPWRPDRGVPALADDDPYGHGTAALRARVDAYLAGEFLVAAARLAHPAALWQLDVVYPDGSVDERWLDLAGVSGGWLDKPPRPPRLVTSVAASTLAGLRDGEVTPYRAILTRRVAARLYEAVPGGVRRTGGPGDDPIGRVLFPGAGRRFVDAELRRLGYRV